MSESLALSPAKYYEEAKYMLEQKDLLGFVAKVSIAIEVSGNDLEILKRATYLEAEGLFKLHQHKKALDAISKALEYNSGEQILTLRIYEGIIHGYLGELDQAINTFKSIINQTEDDMVLCKAYMNIAWVHTTLDKKNLDDDKLEESKKYLDSVNEYFESLTNSMKLRLQTNYSVYFFHKGDLDKAIEILEDSIKYCEEKDLPDVFNNLAELYIKLSNEGEVFEVVKEYLDKAEILGTRYNKTISLGYTFSFKAEIELMEEQLFSALETLYLAFEYFKEAEATVKACDTLLRINQLLDTYKHSNLNSLRENMKNKLKDTQES